MSLYVAYALAFAWAGATIRWPFLVGAVAGVAATVAEWRTRTPYPRHVAGVHVAPGRWRTQRLLGIFGLPAVFVAFAADYLAAGVRVLDAFGVVALAVLFVAALVWSSRDVVDRVEVEEGGLVLHALLGLRAVALPYPDVSSVSDRGGDGFLRVRDRHGKSYLLSPELSDFERLRETLGQVVRASAPETMGSRNAP